MKQFGVTWFVIIAMVTGLVSISMPSSAYAKSAAQMKKQAAKAVDEYLGEIRETQEAVQGLGSKATIAHRELLSIAGQLLVPGNDSKAIQLRVMGANLRELKTRYRQIKKEYDEWIKSSKRSRNAAIKAIKLLEAIE